MLGEYNTLPLLDMRLPDGNLVKTRDVLNWICALLQKWSVWCETISEESWKNIAKIRDFCEQKVVLHR